MKLVLNSLIEKKHVTSDQINYRITCFDYGFADRRNKPSVISKNDMRNIDGAMLQVCCPDMVLTEVVAPHGR